MIIKFNNIKAVLEPEGRADKSILDKLKTKTQVMAPGAFYTYQYKLWRKTKGKAGWNGKVNILTKNSILTGILPYFIELLEKESVSLKLIDERPIAWSKSLKGYSVALRDYQKEAWKASISNSYNNLWWPRGVLEMATGAGKTEVAVALYEATQVPTLFLVHLKSLIFQTKDRFKKYGINAGVVGDGIFDPNLKGITIATMQTLASLVRSKRWTDFNSICNATEQVFFDEAHLVAASIDKGNQFVSISNALTNAYIRWGLTATPFMRDNYSNLLLEGVTGRVLYTIKNKELIDKGYLTPPKVRIIPVPAVPCKKSWPDCYNSAIILNTIRNKLIVNELKTLPKPCLVMCIQISHAEIIQRAAKNAGISMPMLSGVDPVKKRREVLSQMASGKVQQVVCTTIFDEGLDLPELRSLILAGAGKSRVKQLQKVGRGLRLADGKHEVIIVDFNDTSARLLKEHSKRRRRIWENEGFKIE